MTVAVLVMADGRDAELDRAVASAANMLTGPISELWMHDDTGDPARRRLLAERFPLARHIGEGPRRGYGGAIGYAWKVLTARSHARHILHLEGDFVFTRQVDLASMAEVLDAHPHLAQMALRRQPWNAAERAAGGVVELSPGAFVEMVVGRHRWLQHRLWWTTNPSLFRRDLCAVGWPAGAASEGRFGLELQERGLPWGVPAGGVRFGYWGGLGEGPWVEHIGVHRAGTGY